MRRLSLTDMDTAALVIIAGLGVVVGLFGAVAWWQTRRISDLREVAGTHDGDEVDRVPISQLLGVLPGASILVHGSNGTVERATAKSFSLGLVVSNRLASEEMNAMVAEVHRDGITREYDINITRPALARGELELRVRAAAVGEDAVLLLIDDLSGARRVDTVRRDFVANVSHELKTPVGALSLLAEAVSVAADVSRRSEIATSACCMAMASLMPSPIKQTVLPCACRRVMADAFSSGRAPAT